jgi:hypothetical protein
MQKVISRHLKISRGTSNSCVQFGSIKQWHVVDGSVVGLRTTFFRLSLSCMYLSMECAYLCRHRETFHGRFYGNDVFDIDTEPLY